MAAHYEKCGQGQVPKKNDPCPVAVVAPERGAGLGNNSVEPFDAQEFVVNRQSSPRGVYPISKEPKNPDRAERQSGDDEFHPVPIETLRQYDLPVVVRVHRGLMMFDMADAEADVISPAKKGINLQKNLIPSLGAKRGLVDKFVNGSYK